MRRCRIINFCLVTGAALILSLAGTTPSARAAFHLWQIKEVFSNADGSVQFIELFDDFNDEQYVGGKIVEASSDGVVKTFTFPSDLTVPPTTAGRHMLIATPGFGSLPGGVTPSFTFDQSTTPFAGPLFNPNASEIIISFPFSTSDMGVSGAASPPDGFVALPKDGVHSITNTNLYNDPILVVGTNSPTNFNNQSGSINLAVPEPAGGLLAIALCGLLGLRLRSNRGDFA